VVTRTVILCCYARLTHDVTRLCYTRCLLICASHCLTGLNIATFVFTDSGPDCVAGEGSQMQPVKAALNNVGTSFPKYYFSKQNMMMNQWDLTNKCNAHGGHTVEPMNIVMWNRYFNLVCNPSNPPPQADPIPACVDLGDYTNTNDRCYGGSGPDNDWFDNIFEVCLLNHQNIANGAADPHGPGCRVRATKTLQQTQQRRACKLQFVGAAETGGVFDSILQRSYGTLVELCLVRGQGLSLRFIFLWFICTDFLCFVETYAPQPTVKRPSSAHLSTLAPSRWKHSFATTRPHNVLLR
jgi:hypothetical protein